MKAVSGKRIARILEKRGWRLSRINGSHHYFKHPQYGKVAVPIHGNRTLKPGTQIGIMKAAGIAKDEL